jgi:hypothetical protein
MFFPVGQQASITQGHGYPLVRADAGPSAVNGLGGCGCTGIRSVGRVDPAGLGVNPDGLGEGPALFASVTGSPVLDALLGGALGYFIAPAPHERTLWAAGGATAAALAGTLGVVASVGAAIYVRKPRST